MATMNVRDAAGTVVAVEKPLAPDRAAAALSRPIVLSAEDFAALQAVATEATLSFIDAVMTSVHDVAASALKSLLVGTDGVPLSTEFAVPVELRSAVTGEPLSLDGDVPIRGNLPHGDQDTTPFPIGIGGKSVAALSGLTLPLAGRRVNAAFDLDGAFITRNGGAIGDRISGRAVNTDGAVQDCLAAQAAGIKINLTDIILSNSSATFVEVDILDGATIKATFGVPPTSSVPHRFETPLTGTAATAWRFDPSAAVTSIKCSMSGRISKV